MPEPTAITELLDRFGAGDRGALEELLPLIYDELHGIAARQMKKERSDHTLQPTALVHEAYVKLCQQSSLGLESRSHFLGVAARAMRQILVDHARRKGAAKRGDGWKRESLTDLSPGLDSAPLDVLALDEALTKLAERDPRKARAVELRYFGGFSAEEAAEILEVDARTVERDWNYALAWLFREMSRGDEEDS